MIARTAGLLVPNKAEFDDIAGNRQRFVSVLDSSHSGVGTILTLQDGATGGFCHRVVCHRSEAFEGRSMLSLRPLTGLEKATMAREAAPCAPAEAG